MVAYPFLRARQVCQGGMGKGHVLVQLREMYNDDGFRSLYQGCTSELARGMMFQGLLMAFREKLYPLNVRLLMPQEALAKQ